MFVLHDVGDCRVCKDFYKLTCKFVDETVVRLVQELGKEWLL